MSLLHRIILCFILAAGLVWSAAGSATDSTASSYTPLPAACVRALLRYVLAPNTPSIATTAQPSVAKYFHLGIPPVPGQELMLPVTGTAIRPAAVVLAPSSRTARGGGRCYPGFGGTAPTQGGP